MAFGRGGRVGRGRTHRPRQDEGGMMQQGGMMYMGVAAAVQEPGPVPPCRWLVNLQGLQRRENPAGPPRDRGAVNRTQCYEMSLRLPIREAAGGLGGHQIGVKKVCLALPVKSMVHISLPDFSPGMDMALQTWPYVIKPVKTVLPTSSVDSMDNQSMQKTMYDRGQKSTFYQYDEDYSEAMEWFDCDVTPTQDAQSVTLQICFSADDSDDSDDSNRHNRQHNTPITGDILFEIRPNALVTTASD